MYDAGKIVPGLIVFLVLITAPAWYSVATGKAVRVIEPEIVAEEKQCIESADYMRARHMDILVDDWREAVVREGIRSYVGSDGREYEISLTETCLGCHSNKSEFCDKCHNYVGVRPDCWDCHNVPEED